MKNYIFLCSILLVGMSSCSDDINAERKILIETKNLIEHNFIPTIESYFGKDHIGTAANRSSSLSGIWIHQFDGKGRLIMSQLFEKHPNRILKEIIYSDYDIITSKVNLEVHVFNYYTLATYDSESFILNFDESYTLMGISPNINGVDSHSNTVFLELDDNRWITLMKHQNIDGYVGYEYDPQGKILKYIVYNDDLIVKSSVEYTYTDFGDLKSYDFQNTEGNIGKAECFYRSDNTLERLEESFDYGREYIGKSVYTYSNNEADLKRITDFENGKREIVLNYEEQIIKEYYEENERLTEVFKYKFSNSMGKYFLEEYKKYNDNGNLEYTEIYDEDGNVTETIYE